jgi:hypothetical protein
MNEHNNMFTSETKDDLVIGDSDMIEEVPLELLRMMTSNSRALETLPGQRLVNVPGNKG